MQERVDEFARTIDELGVSVLDFILRRMGDSNPRGLSPNTLSKRAP